MDLDLDGTVVLVSGGTGDIGVATARVLGPEGAILALAGRSDATLAPVVGALRERGHRARGFVADLAASDGVADLVRRVEEHCGPIGGLVNTVGPMRHAPTGPQLHADDDLWRFHFESTLMPTVRLCREVIPLMTQRGRGSVVNLAATSARHYAARHASYAAMKAAVAHVTKDFARDAAPHGVRVNCVHPGWISKDSTKRRVTAAAAVQGVTEAEVVQQMLTERSDDMYYTKRFGEPEEYAQVIAFLLSERASYVNAAWLAVDGGSAT